MRVTIPAKISVWYLVVSFILLLGAVPVADSVDFIPSRSWVLVTGVVTGLITVCLSWNLVPGVFNRLRRNRLSATGLLVFILWCGPWCLACEIGGLVTTGTVGMPHSEIMEGNIHRCNGYPYMACWLRRYYVSLTTGHDLWGSDLSISSDLYLSSPNRIAVKLQGMASFAGFKVSSISRVDSLNLNGVTPNSQRIESLDTMTIHKTADLILLIGDSVETVQKKLQTDIKPEPSQSAIVDGATSLRLGNRGIWVFFDKQGKVYTIRLDKPYSGSVNKIVIGDSQADVLNLLGKPPLTMKKYIPTAGESAPYIYYVDDVTKVKFSFDVNNKVETIFLFK